MARGKYSKVTKVVCGGGVGCCKGTELNSVASLKKEYMKVRSVKIAKESFFLRLRLIQDDFISMIKNLSHPCSRQIKGCAPPP